MAKIKKVRQFIIFFLITLLVLQSNVILLESFQTFANEENKQQQQLPDAPEQQSGVSQTASLDTAPSPSPKPSIPPVTTPTPLEEPSLLETITPLSQKTEAGEETSTEKKNDAATPAAIVMPMSTATPEAALWEKKSDGSYTTVKSVVLGTLYTAPFNNKVSVRFAQLPSSSGIITIKELSLTLSNGQIGSAYEITSSMANTTFQYDLTLPMPIDTTGNIEGTAIKSDDATVSFSENGKDFQTVDNKKTVDASNDSITIKDLNHFTIFVLVANPSGITDGMLAAIGDTEIRENNTGNNYGSDTTFHVYSQSTNKDRRVLVKFDLTAIVSGSAISTATVSVKLVNAPGTNRQYDIYRVTSAWDEKSVTWSTRPSIAASLTSSTASGVTNDVTLSWDVTADAQAFLSGTTNNGWVIRDATEESTSANTNQATFASRENGTNAARPQLSIDFASPSPADTTNFNSPTSHVAVTSSAGDNNGYNNAGNAFSGDGSFAVDNNSGSNSNSNCTGSNTDKHVFSNYNITIPTGASINGIEVRQDLAVDSLNDSPFTCVQLSWDGGTTWTSVNQQSLTETRLHPYYFGSSTDLWGRTWTAAELANANFKVRLANGDTDNGGSTRDFDLDWVPVSVYFVQDTTAPTNPTDIASTTHTSGTASLINTIDMQWTPAGSAPGAIDAGGGVDGYSYSFTQGASDTPDMAKDAEETATATTSGVLTDGLWYFHFRTVDTVGNWSSAVHFGPYLVDTLLPGILYIHPLGGATTWYITDPGSVLDIDFLWQNGAPLDKAQYKIDTGIYSDISTIDQSADYTTNWGIDWSLLSEGMHDITLQIQDTAGNVRTHAFVSGVSGLQFGRDTQPPATPSATPTGGDYFVNQLVTLTSTDGASGVTAIYFTTDGATPSASLGTLYTTPILIDKSMTIKAIAYDIAGNSSNILTAVYGIAPVVSDEAAAVATDTSTTITWTTDDPATSRVVYDTVSHLSNEITLFPPNYSYAFSTIEQDSVTKVTTHTVVLTNLTPGTTYYYRVVSHGSPEIVGSEKTFTTKSAPSNPGGTSGSGGTGGSGGSSASVPTCHETKPGSAPVLREAIAGSNSVTLRWHEAKDPVSYYLVAYGLLSGNLRYGNPQVGGKGTTEYTVRGLSGGTTYYFKVRGGNGCQPGDFSNEIAATPGGGTRSGGQAVDFAEGILGQSTSSAALTNAAQEKEKLVEGAVEESQFENGTLALVSSWDFVKKYWLLLLIVLLMFFFMSRWLIRKIVQ